MAGAEVDMRLNLYRRTCWVHLGCWVAICLGLSGFAGVAWAQSPLSQDPIALVGHGVALDAEGQPLELGVDEIREIQLFYLEQLEPLVPQDEWSNYVAVRENLIALMSETGFDEIQTDSWLIAWMLEDYGTEQVAKLQQHNLLLRKDYSALKGDPGEMSKELTEALESLGVKPIFGTTAYGEQYIQECRDAGVPIPPDWGSAQWIIREPSLPSRFDFVAGAASEAKVHTYTSASPRGGCIALPRYVMVGGVPSLIDALGIICLGQDTSKACFWDANDVPVDVQKPLTEFTGGAELEWNPAAGGICSDCHAGENPWVIHPETALGMGTMMPNDWHEPLVHPDWPQNPGPTVLLDAPPYDAMPSGCKGCHAQGGSGGRFPEVSTELVGYCRTVLGNAVWETMPNTANTAYPGSTGSTFMMHASALLAACRQAPSEGEGVAVTDVQDNEGFISPPMLVGPLYACAESLEVRGAIRHAEVRVFIDGVLEASVEFLQPDGHYVPIRPLVAGEKVTATQVFNGVESDSSTPVVVRDHSVDYPNGLPAPSIDPDLIYECGRVIAVRHVRGSLVTVYTNGGDPITYAAPGDWTNLPPKIRPFNLGDKFSAEQSLCSDTSPISDSQIAVAEPTVMPTPQISPAPLVEGQEMVDLSNLAHGALTHVDVLGFGLVSSFSTAVSWQPDLDIESAMMAPLSMGDVLSVRQTLCDDGPIAYANEAEPCDEIPAPVIRNPTEGDEFVIVLDSIPGARIRVYDELGQEIADGSGTIIATGRSLVAGEILTAVQEVGPCTSNTAFQVMTNKKLMFTPEPGSVGMLAMGILALFWLSRKRSRGHGWQQIPR